MLFSLKSPSLKLLLVIILSQFNYMANSGIYWIDQTFNFCVRILIDLSNVFGISYEEINVWLFCVFWPLASLLLFAEVIRLRMKLGSSYK